MRLGVKNLELIQSKCIFEEQNSYHQFVGKTKGNNMKATLPKLTENALNHERVVNSSYLSLSFPNTVWNFELLRKDLYLAFFIIIIT